MAAHPPLHLQPGSPTLPRPPHIPSAHCLGRYSLTPHIERRDPPLAAQAPAGASLDSLLHPKAAPSSPHRCVRPCPPSLRWLDALLITLLSQPEAWPWKPCWTCRPERSHHRQAQACVTRFRAVRGGTKGQFPFLFPLSLGPAECPHHAPQPARQRGPPQNRAWTPELP